MATNRTPISRDPAKRITPKALAAYRRLLAAEDDDQYAEARTELSLALAEHRGNRRLAGLMIPTRS